MHARDSKKVYKSRGDLELINEEWWINRSRGSWARWKHSTRLEVRLQPRSGVLVRSSRTISYIQCRACIPSCDNNSGSSLVAVLLGNNSEESKREWIEFRCRRQASCYCMYTPHIPSLSTNIRIYTYILIHTRWNRFVPNKRTGWLKSGVGKWTDSFSGSLYIQRRLFNTERILSRIFYALLPALSCGWIVQLLS